MPLFTEGVDLYGKCCSIVAIFKVRSPSHTCITRNHICRHGNAKECAKTAGYTYCKQSGHNPHAVAQGALPRHMWNNFELNCDRPTIAMGAKRFLAMGFIDTTSAMLFSWSPATFQDFGKSFIQ